LKRSFFKISLFFLPVLEHHLNYMEESFTESNLRLSDGKNKVFAIKITHVNFTRRPHVSVTVVNTYSKTLGLIENFTNAGFLGAESVCLNLFFFAETFRSFVL